MVKAGRVLVVNLCPYDVIYNEETYRSDGELSVYYSSETKTSLRIKMLTPTVTVEVKKAGKFSASPEQVAEEILNVLHPLDDEELLQDVDTVVVIVVPQVIKILRNDLKVTPQVVFVAHSLNSSAAKDKEGNVLMVAARRLESYA